MIRKTIGLILIVTGLALKAALNHNLDYWTTVKSWTGWFIITGIILFCIPLLERIKYYRPSSSLSKSRKGLFYFVKILGGFCVFIAIVSITFGIEHIGIILNEQLRDYYLSKNIGLTEGRIIGETEVPYIIKNQLIYEKFLILEYQTVAGLIRQGMQPRDTLMVGQAFIVNYSVKHPTFFKIK